VEPVRDSLTASGGNCIHSNRKQFFIGYSTVFLSYGAMRVEQHAGSRAEWLAAAVNHVGVSKLDRWSMRARRDERHAKAVRTGIVFSLFLVLLTAALLVGGRALIDPLLEAAADNRESNRVGEIVYTMPDGAFCRHLAFDNVTGEVTERTIEQCDQNIGRQHTRGRAGFAWRAR
jgi:hypothetical protein